MPNEPDIKPIVEALKNAKPLDLRIQPFSAFVLIGYLQFALRHPEVQKQQLNYEVGLEIAQTLQHHLGQQSPVIAENLEMGWNPEFDQPPAEPTNQGCKYADLDQVRQRTLAVNALALDLAIQKIAALSGKTIEESSHEISNLAVETSEHWSPDQVAFTIATLDIQPEPIEIDFN